MLSATAIGTALVRVIYSEPMGSGALDPANYTITPDGGSDARTVTGVAFDGDAPALGVILTLDGNLTPGVDNYNVAADSDVRDFAGNSIDAAYDDVDFSGTYTAPAIVSACDAGLARLLSQFGSSPLLRALICSLADPADLLAQALTDVQTYRSLDTAIGVQLDALGDLIGLLRNGDVDADYRRFLRAKVAANASHGHADELIEILELLDNGFAPSEITLTEHFPATVILHALVPEVGGLTLGARFVEILRQAKANAVRLILEFEEDGVVLFTFDEDVGAGLPAPPADSGWDTIGDGSEGGRWAMALD